MKQQIKQIQWIDATINSHSVFYKSLHCIRSLLFICFKKNAKPQHKILDVIHSRNKNDQCKVVNVDSQDNDIDQDLRSKLDDLCIR